MPPSKIQADYDSLSAIASSFSQRASETTRLFQQVQKLVQSLQGGGWTGVGAAAFFREMEELVNPAMQRLVSALEDAGSATQKISQMLQQAEEEAARCFEATGGDYSQSGQGRLLDNSDMAAIRDGEAGYTLTRGDRNDASWVYQVGQTCGLYSIVNTLNAGGEAFSQEQIDSWAASMLARRESGDTEGFTRQEITTFLREKGIDLYWSDFSVSGAPQENQAAAEKFLINAIQQGVPVRIDTFIEDTFGVPGRGHAYTVIGARMAQDGRLNTVLVHTNWSSEPFYEISADNLMRDWAGNQYQHMIRRDHLEMLN